jgi:hypothetical protein
MSKHHHDPGTRLYEEVQARQRNTTWPDAVRNASSVDELVFKGSPTATRGQRAGVFVLGVLYILAGGSFILMGEEQHTIGLIALAVIGLAVGAWIIRNAFLRLERKPRNRHPHRIPTDPQ